MQLKTVAKNKTRCKFYYPQEKIKQWNKTNIDNWNELLDI